MKKSMHINESIPVTITHVTVNRKSAKKRGKKSFVFCVVCFLNGHWFKQRGQTLMFAREIIYTPYFYLQKRNHMGSINEFSSKTRLSLIDRMTKHNN